jgi:hypothetical protein
LEKNEGPIQKASSCDDASVLGLIRVTRIISPSIFMDFKEQDSASAPPGGKQKEEGRLSDPLH